MPTRSVLVAAAAAINVGNGAGRPDVVGQVQHVEAEVLGPTRCVLQLMTATWPRRRPTPNRKSLVTPSMVGTEEISRKHVWRRSDRAILSRPDFAAQRSTTAQGATARSGPS